MQPKFIKPLSHCTEQETISFLMESLRQAADIARQMAKAQGKNKWNLVATLLDKIHYKSKSLSTARSLNRTDTLFLLDQENRKMIAEEEKKKSVH